MIDYLLTFLGVLFDFSLYVMSYGLICALIAKFVIWKMSTKHPTDYGGHDCHDGIIRMQGVIGGDNIYGHQNEDTLIWRIFDNIICVFGVPVALFNHGVLSIKLTLSILAVLASDVIFLLTGRSYPQHCKFYYIDESEYGVHSDLPEWYVEVTLSTHDDLVELHTIIIDYTQPKDPFDGDDGTKPA